MDAIGGPALWAESGGLLGLVILALFGTLALGLYSASGIVRAFRDEVCKVLENHARERERMMSIIDTRQNETNEVIRGLSSAINRMADRSRRYDPDQSNN